MYLVTGGAGFIGSNLVRALNARGIGDILVVDDLRKGDRFRNLRDLDIADYMDRDELRGRLEGMGSLPPLDAVLHQGACADTTESDGRYMLDNNFTYSKLLLTWAQEAGAPMVYASSAAVYGMNEASEPVPANEAPLNVYGYSKLLFDQYVRKLGSKLGPTVVGLRYFNVYGPGEHQKGRMASMPYQLYKQLDEQGVCRLFEGTDGYEHGEQRRDFVFVGDIVDINLHFMDTDGTHAIVNAGTGASRAFNDIAKILIEARQDGRIEYIPFPESLAGKYQSFTQAHLDSLRAAGYTREMTSLEEGINACLPVWQQEG